MELFNIMSVTGGAAANDDHSDKHKLQVSAVTRSFQMTLISAGWSRNSTVTSTRLRCCWETVRLNEDQHSDDDKEEGSGGYYFLRIRKGHWTMMAMHCIDDPDGQGDNIYIVF